MKWIFGALLLCNVGLFLWTYGHRPDSTEFIRPPVSGETMMLLNEITSVRSTPVVNSTRDQSAQPSLCLRIGPFFDQNLAKKTSVRLKSWALPFDTRSVKARKIRAYRVYVGPFATSSEVEAQRKLLTDSGIKDHYVKRQAGEQEIVSLGLFTQSNGAEALVQELKAKNILAQTKPEDRTLKPTYWLELRDTKANQLARPRLASAKWGDERARLSEFPCS